MHIVSHNHNAWLLISKGLGRDKRTFGISVCEYKSYSMYWKIVTNNVYVRSWWNKCYILWSKSRGCDCYWSNISPVIMTFTQNSDTFLVSPKCTITMLVSNSKCSINDQHIEINHFWFSLYRPNMKHKSWKHTLSSRHVLASSLIAFMLSHCLPNLLRAVTVTNRQQHCLRFCRQ